MVRKHVIVRGMVQGVGFRYFAARRAETLGVAGWARNVRDGTVEIEAQADDEKMQAFLDAIREGPSFSRVRSLDIADLPDSPELAEFEIRF